MYIRTFNLFRAKREPIFIPPLGSFTQAQTKGEWETGHGKQLCKQSRRVRSGSRKRA